MEENKIESDFLSQLGYTAFSINKNNAITVLLKYKDTLIEQAKKGKLTLQECKDQVAKKHGHENWDFLCFSWAGFVKVVEPFMDEAAEMYRTQDIQIYSDHQYEVLKKYWIKALEINPPSKKEIYVITKHKGIYANKTVTTLKFFYSESEAEIYKNRLDKLYDKAYDFYNSWVERLGGLDQELPDDEFDHIDLILEKSQNYLEISLYIEKVILHT